MPSDTPAFLRVTMPDGSQWDVPVYVIAQNRAAHYASEWGGDVSRSLQEDTWPLFRTNYGHIEDWAANNMNWADVQPYAVRRHEANDVDYQEGWVNGEKEII